MRKALKKRGINIVDLGSPTLPSRWDKPLKILGKIKKSFGNINSNNSSQYDYHQFIDQVQCQLNNRSCDLIFAPVAKEELSFFETSLPLIFFSDATAKLLREDYKKYQTEQEFWLASKQEISVISRANKLVYSSQWAANSAICDYGADPKKIEILPLGANIDTVPTVDDILTKISALQCRLLFIGKDWERKGGKIAFQTLLSLIERGIDAQLVMVGCLPPPEIQHKNLTIIPYLNKDISRQQERLSQLLLKSHFLIFPTRADCSPIVICEANAYGIPALTTEIGGIPTIIKNGQNGYMLPLSASGEEYANIIGNNFYNKAAYEQLVLASREQYDTRLNWDKWAEGMHQIIIDTLRGK